MKLTMPLSMHMELLSEGVSSIGMKVDGGGVPFLVDDCHPIFKNIVINGDDMYERLVPVDEVWYDTSDGEIMD